jgi:hypothetical protein
LTEHPLHPRDPSTVWVFPMDGSDVWASADEGAAWHSIARHLPEI